MLTQQGDEASELYVILDGLVSVEVDGRELGDLGPGAVVGERALLEGGRRTATLRAITPVRVAAAAGSTVSLHALREAAPRSTTARTRTRAAPTRSRFSGRVRAHPRGDGWIEDGGQGRRPRRGGRRRHRRRPHDLHRGQARKG